MGHITETTQQMGQIGNVTGQMPGDGTATSRVWQSVPIRAGQFHTRSTRPTLGDGTLWKPVWNDLESLRAMIVDHGPDLRKRW